MKTESSTTTADKKPASPRSLRLGTRGSAADSKDSQAAENKGKGDERQTTPTVTGKNNDEVNNRNAVETIVQFDAASHKAGE